MQELGAWCHPSLPEVEKTPKIVPHPSIHLAVAQQPRKRLWVEVDDLDAFTYTCAVADLAGTDQERTVFECRRDGVRDKEATLIRSSGGPVRERYQLVKSGRSVERRQIGLESRADVFDAKLVELLLDLSDPSQYRRACQRLGQSLQILRGDLRRKSARLGRRML